MTTGAKEPNGPKPEETLRLDNFAALRFRPRTRREGRGYASEPEQSEGKGLNQSRSAPGQGRSGWATERAGHGRVHWTIGGFRQNGACAIFRDRPPGMIDISRVTAGAERLFE